MRKLFSVIILGLCFLAPVQRLDVAKLQPVQTVALYMQDEYVVLQTDAGDKGFGLTALEALTDLKENALTVIYLDTAEYLLVGEGAENQVEQLSPVLHKHIKVGRYAGGDVKEETIYWEIHGKLPKLEAWIRAKK